MTRSSHKRTGTDSRLKLPSFSDESVYCEAFHEPDDVLYSGSDDESYESTAARLHCYEHHARQFLQGTPPFILSASLRGPFGKESGWQNPWRGRGGRAVPAKPKRPRTRDGVSEPAQAQDSSNPEKRVATKSNWLRRDNLKRPTSSHGDDVFAASPKQTESIYRSKSRKLADSTRAFSEPVEIDDSTVFGGIRDLIPDESPRKLAREKVATKSQTTIMGRAASLPADCSPGKASNSDSNEDRPSTSPSSSEAVQEAEIVAPAASEGEVAEPDAPSVGEQETHPPPFDGTTLVSANHEDAAEEDALMRNVYETDSSDPVAAELSSAESDDLAEMQNAHTVASLLLSKLEAIGSQSMPETPADETPDAATTTDTEESRLATQDQSPWAKSVDIPPSVEEPPVLESLETEPDQPQLDKNSLEALTRVQTQSPWLEESSFDAPFLGRKGVSSSLPPVESARLKKANAGDLRVSLSQNPWVEESSHEHNSTSSSLPDRLISPCSPTSDERPQTPDQQEEGPTLPPLSAIVIPSSLGTAPSTPETKQSSLPTPDLTVSIKSFRRFRSPTPTPPPRQRAKQSGGLRSVLVHPRSRRSGSPSNKHSRRVRFSLQKPDEEMEMESNALFAYHYGMVDEDEFSEYRASSHGPRATSPPPQDAVLAGVLPSEVEKFQGHFATVTSRSQWQAAAKGATGPAGSSLRALGQSKGAQSDEAMSETLRLQGRPAPDRHTGRKEHDACGEDKENSQEAADEQGRVDEADIVSHVDDVEEVLQNLGDFLGMWDVDTELANI